MGQMVVKSQQLPSLRPTKPQTTTQNNPKALNLYSKSLLQREKKKKNKCGSASYVRLRPGIVKSCSTSRGEETVSKQSSWSSPETPERAHIKMSLTGGQNTHLVVATHLQELLSGSQSPLHCRRVIRVVDRSLAATKLSDSWVCSPYMVSAVV